MRLTNGLRSPSASRRTRIGRLLVLAFTLPTVMLTGAQSPAAPSASAPADSGRPTTRPSSPGAAAAPALAAMPEPGHLGGEAQSIVQVANLIYAGSKSSRCFSDYFLVQAEKASAISTSRRFHSVKLDSEELFSFPMVIMTGEGTFVLPQKERENLQRYIRGGGFLLASAGCSSQEWDRSFRAEMSRVFEFAPLQPIGMDHQIFHLVYDVLALNGAHGAPRQLEGIIVNGGIGVIYSQDGLNDTQHSQGCCCCGGNEITNAIEVNVNILAYALTH